MRTKKRSAFRGALIFSTDLLEIMYRKLVIHANFFLLFVFCKKYSTT